MFNLVIEIKVIGRKIFKDDKCRILFSSLVVWERDWVFGWKGLVFCSDNSVCILMIVRWFFVEMIVYGMG